MYRHIRTSILKTLIYSDIFDYPLKKDEIWRFLIGPEKISKEKFEKSLKDISSKELSFRKSEAIEKSHEDFLLGLEMTEENNFYFLSNRSEILDKRLTREKESKIKFQIAQRVSGILSLIPTVQLIGISGALAMENADKNDDIDFFIIAKKNTLWTTRLLILVFLQILGKRRKRLSRKVADKICLNMLTDETTIEFPKEKQNLYLAHEITQMKPIFNRNKSYQKFIAANMWVKEHLPNSLDTKILRYKDTKRENKKSLNISISQYLNIFFSMLEYLAKKIQLWSIEKHRTTEVLSDKILAFHPLDHRSVVMKEYNEKLRKYKIK